MCVCVFMCDDNCLKFSCIMTLSEDTYVDKMTMRLILKVKDVKKD